MGPHVGDHSAGDTIYLMFDTTDSAGASVVMTAAGTIRVYKDGGTTESTTGITVSNDFDGRTGLHQVAIDTSADSTFYSVGSDFHVCVTAATIDGAVVNAHLGSFSLENRRNEVLEHAYCAAINTATTFTLGGSGLSAVDDFYNGMLLVSTSGANKPVARIITDYVGATKVVTVQPAYPTAPALNERFQIMGWA